MVACMRKGTLNNKGVALVTVVLFFLVLVILLGGVMFSSISNQGNAKLSKDHTSAYYVAESGLNITIEKLKAFLVAGAYNNIPVGQYISKMAELKTYIDGLDGNSTNMTLGTYTVNTDTSSSPYILRSTSNVDGTSRTVQTSFEITPKLEDKAKAIITKGGISSSNGTIIGPIASLMQPAGSDIMLECNPSGAATVISDIYYPIPLPSGSTVSIDPDCKITPTTNDIDINVVFNTFSLPTYYTKNSTVSVGGVTKNALVKIEPVSGVYTFPTLSEGQIGYYLDTLPSSDVEFKLGNGATTSVFQLFIEDVQASNSSELGVGNINVTGNGQLKVLMTIDQNDFDKNNSNVFIWDGNINSNQLNNNDAEIAKFQLIIKRGSGFDVGEYPLFSISNSNVFVGSLMMDYVDIIFGNFDFKGFIATLGEKITFGSTANITGPMWIYAPNAEIISNSNVVIKGSIIAESVDFKNTTLEYLQYTGPLPPELNLPLFLGGAPVPVGITVKFINFKEV